MRLTDGSFGKHKVRYIMQSLLATVTVLGVLLVLDATKQTAIIASIGASSFIVFTSPKSRASTLRALLGGYAIGCASGIVCSLLVAQLTGDTGSWNELLITFGSLSVGLSIFLMVITDTEHPPAAALALAFVLNEWDWSTLLVVGVSIGFLALVKTFFRNYIRDLL